MHDDVMEAPAGELSDNDGIVEGNEDEEAGPSPASSGMSSESFVEEMILKPLKHGEQWQPK